MGTNYYTGKNFCKCCNRWDEDLHIGKYSYGWAFNFRGYKNDGIMSWSDWKDYLQDQMIFNEYGERITLQDFVRTIETYGSPTYLIDGKKNHVRPPGSLTGREWVDLQGYCFTEDCFS